MPCIELLPAPECGIRGKCVEEGNISFCVCDSKSGPVQSPEFAYFNPDDTLESGACFYFENYFRVVFVLIIILGSAYLSVTFFLIKKKSSLRRATPDIVSFIAIITASIIRLSSDGAFFGEHTIFTLLVCWAFAFQHIGMTIFYFRYLRYMYSKILISRNREKMESRLRVLHLTSYCLIFVDASIFNIWGVLALQTNTRMKLAGLRTLMTYHVCRSFFNVFLTYYLYGEMIRDMNSLVGSKGEVDVTLPSQNNNNIDYLIERALPRAKATQKVVMVFCILVGTLGIPFLVWDFLTQAAVYPIYTFWAIWPCLHIFIVRESVRKKLAKLRLQSKKAAESSFNAATSATKTKLDDNMSANPAIATTIENIRYFEKTEMEPSTFDSSRMSF